MDGYAVFFEYNKKVYRLPINPEQITTSRTMAVEKYDILKLGQIAVPTNMELTEYSFECEFPVKRGNYIPHYVETQNEFHGSDYYLSLFNKWQDGLVPVQFMAGRENDDDIVKGSINSLVLIEEMEAIEKAGEEGDKYVSFKLLEYKNFGKQTSKEVDPKTGKAKKKTASVTNPKSAGTYVVKENDNLYNIAKKFYGDGTKYTKIYNANKDKIKNPALIYKGQKLVIPA